jgi:nucleoside-diphosphate-sugar epimerase
VNLFVTGAHGFIGHHVVRQALAAGHAVTALQRPGLTHPTKRSADGLAWAEGTLDDPGLIKHLQSCTVLLHLAGVGIPGLGKADWCECFDVNVRKSLQCWRHALKASVRRIVVCGSCAEYGKSAERYEFIPPDALLEPIGPYGASKACASMAALGLAQEEGLELAILRPFQVFGEGEQLPRLWPALRQAAESGKDFPMTAGEQVRDFVPVEAVAAAFVDFAVHRPLQPGKPVIRNVGTGRPQSLRDFAEHWWKHWNAKGRLLPGAMPYRASEVMRLVPLVEA